MHEIRDIGNPAHQCRKVVYDMTSHNFLHKKDTEVTSPFVETSLRLRSNKSVLT